MASLWQSYYCQIAADAFDKVLLKEVGLMEMTKLKEIFGRRGKKIMRNKLKIPLSIIPSFVTVSLNGVILKFSLSLSCNNPSLFGVCISSMRLLSFSFHSHQNLTLFQAFPASQSLFPRDFR
ncbi:hypothetical protein Csa_009378, partial [Cucumis sativus]